MIHVNIENEGNTIFLNGVVFEEDGIPIEFRRPDRIDNIRPSIINRTPIEVDEEDEDQNWQDYLSDQITVSISPTNGDILNEDNVETILIPRLSVNGEPKNIDKFKWYKNGAFLNESQIYLRVGKDDIDNMSDIYTIEVYHIEDKDERTYEESIQIINIQGLRTIIEDQDEKTNPDEGDFDPNAIFNWGDLGVSFVQSDDYREKDIFRIAQDIKDGSPKMMAFIRTFEIVAERIFKSVIRNSDRRNTDIPIIDVFYDVNIRLYNLYPEVFEIDNDTTFSDRRRSLIQRLIDRFTQ